MKTQDHIGRLLPEKTETDAIHIAVAPLRAACDLTPGQHVGLTPEGTMGPSNHPLGIVDPFLRENLYQGQLAYLFLYPNTVTGLRHVWTHPAFIESDEALKIEHARTYVTRIAQICGRTYEAMIEICTDYAEDESEFLMDNTERYKQVSCEEWAEFWDHFFVLTEIRRSKIDPVWDLGAPFTCSC